MRKVQKNSNASRNGENENVIPIVVKQQDDDNAVTDVVEKPTKRLSTSLTAGGVRLTILAMRRPDDSGTVFVQTTNIKTGSTERGMTQNFESFDAASDAVKSLALDAQNKGWKRAERAGGFKARPDAFTSIPTPPISKGKK